MNAPDVAELLQRVAAEHETEPGCQERVLFDFDDETGTETERCRACLVDLDAQAHESAHDAWVRHLATAQAAALRAATLDTREAPYLARRPPS